MGLLLKVLEDLIHLRPQKDQFDPCALLRAGPRLGKVSGYQISG